MTRLPPIRVANEVWLGPFGVPPNDPDQTSFGTIIGGRQALITRPLTPNTTGFLAILGSYATTVWTLTRLISVDIDLLEHHDICNPVGAASVLRASCQETECPSLEHDDVDSCIHVPLFVT